LTKNFPQLKQYKFILGVFQRGPSNNQATQYILLVGRHDGYNWDSKEVDGGTCNWVANVCDTDLYSSSSSGGTYGYGYRRLCVKKR